MVDCDIQNDEVGPLLLNFQLTLARVVDCDDLEFGECKFTDFFQLTLARVVDCDFRAARVVLFLNSFQLTLARVVDCDGSRLETHGVSGSRSNLRGSDQPSRF